MNRFALMTMAFLIALTVMVSGCSMEPNALLKTRPNETGDLSAVKPKRVVTDFAGFDEEGNILLYEDTEYGVKRTVRFVPTLDLGMHPKYSTYTLEPIGENLFGENLLLLVIDPATIDRIPRPTLKSAPDFVKNSPAHIDLDELGAIGDLF